LNLSGLPVDHTHILSSEDALALQSAPKHLLVVGGGVIGCELAFVFRSFGSAVTIVEGMERLLPLPSVDVEMSKILQREAKKRGIGVETACTVQAVAVDRQEVRAQLGPSPLIANASVAQKEREISCDAVLVAVGRAPNSAGLGLETAGVKTDAKGWIIADEGMRTSARNIYAIGDALGPSKIMLAHAASAEGLVAVANIFGERKSMGYATVPSSIFTVPEISVVGLSEAEAVTRGFVTATQTTQYREIGKAHAMGEITGVFKLVADRKTGKLLGAHIIGAHASDLVAEAGLALSLGATVRDVAHAIHAHPTLAEGMAEAAHALCRTLDAQNPVPQE
jgi:dihydrolipoamide dehydrogenase